MTPEQRSDVVAILDGARDLTIATLRDDGYPHATTVSFVHDGLSIYFGCDRQSQKARNIAQHDKVALAMELPYDDWEHIRGLSLGGRARMVANRNEIHRVGELMAARFPTFRDYLTQEAAQRMAVIRVEPRVISLLDYRQGFGHTVQITV